MKMRKAQTEATSERMMVSMDFFLLMDERTWLIVGSRLLTLLIFEVMPPNVDR